MKILRTFILGFTFFILNTSQSQTLESKIISDDMDNVAVQDSAADKIIIKNSNNEIMLELNNEVGGGSISLPPVTSINNGASKLYNLGNTLYWDNNPIGLLEQEVPWDIDNNYITLSQPNGLVGIGTLTPQQKLHIENGQILVRGNSNWFPGLTINNSIGRSVLKMGGTVGSNNFSSTEIVLEDLINGKTWSLLNTNLNTLTFVNHLNGTDYESSFRIEYGAPTNSFTINSEGNVGLGTWSSGHKLAVAGTIISEEIIVKLQSDWPDFVFNEDYTLPTLSEQESYIRKNNHLYGVPSAVDVKANGVQIADMQSILLQKIEELTLYIIQQEKDIEILSDQVKELKKITGDLK
jgi:hypothetical protein